MTAPDEHHEGDDGATEGRDHERGRSATAGEGPSLERQLEEARDRLLRTQAEFDNFRKRSRREFDDAQRYREMDLLRDLLPVLDNVLRAVEAAEKAADVETLKSGFRMTAQQIEKLLESHGCRTIETDGQPFDPTIVPAGPSDRCQAGVSDADLRLRL